MKKVIALLLTSLIVLSGLSALDTAKVNHGFDTFVRDIGSTLPDNAVLAGTWSDAYIGQLFSIPPHFGIGASFGGTKLDMSGLNQAAREIGMPTVPDWFFFPTLGFEARIGGFFLPFDIGAKFCYLAPTFNVSGNTLKINHLMAGGDIRYAIIKEGVIAPNLSIGAGYTYVDGSLGTVSGNNNATADITYRAHVIDATVQLSKSFVVVTPFIGARFLVTKTENTWKYAVTSPASQSAAGNYNDTLLSGQVFGGLSVNIFMVKLNATASYNFITQVWGVNGSVRFQL